MSRHLHILGHFPWKMLLFLRNHLVIRNLHIFDYIITGIEWDSYILKKKKKVFLATILNAILDFSARHQLCQFMPAVSETTDYGEHLVYGMYCSMGVRVTTRNSGLFNS